MPTPNSVIVEVSPHSLQIAVVSGDCLVACGDYAFDEKDALAVFIATHDVKNIALALVSPRQPYSWLSGKEALAVCSKKAPPKGLSDILSAAAGDDFSRKPVDAADQAPLSQDDKTVECFAVARDQLTAMGLPAPALAALALPAQLGTVVAALQDMPDSTRVMSLALGENASVLSLVSADGVEAVRSVEIGFTQIFDAVQSELGLKFKGAARNLFFNGLYDFTGAADGIAARLAVAVKGALAEFSDRPESLHVTGLAGKHEWLGLAMGKALGLAPWAPDAARICAQMEMRIVADITPKANTLCLLQLAASDNTSRIARVPFTVVNQREPALIPEITSPPAKDTAEIIDVPARIKRPLGALFAAVSSLIVLMGLGAVSLAHGDEVRTEVPSAPETLTAEQIQQQKAIEDNIPLELSMSRSFRSEKYSFKVSRNGYIVNITDSSNRVLIERLGWLGLVGVPLDGGKSFMGGNSDSGDWVPTITKSVTDGKVIFEILSIYPKKFTISSTITCLHNSIRVETEFKPGILSSARGKLSMQYSVNLNPLLITPGQPGIYSPGEASIITKAGPVVMKFDPAVWGLSSQGKQSIFVKEDAFAFKFDGMGDPKLNVLKAELILP